MKFAGIFANAALGLAGLAGVAYAQEYERGGRACLDGLCLGDGIDALEGITWDTAMSTSGDGPSRTRSVGRGETNRINNRYRGNFSGIIAYLADGRFDNGALAGMRGVTAACENQSMQGTYTSASGNPTLVLVSMGVDPDNPNNHRWEVRRITRRVPAATGAAVQAAEDQLEERYARFTSRNRGPNDDMLQFNNFSGFQYTLTASAPPNEGALLRQHTACGGNGGGPVSID